MVGRGSALRFRARFSPGPSDLRCPGLGHLSRSRFGGRRPAHSRGGRSLEEWESDSRDASSLDDVCDPRDIRARTRDQAPDPRHRAAQSSCRLSTGVVFAPHRAIQRSARIGRGAAPVTRENRSKQEPCSELGTHDRSGDRRAAGGPRPCDQFGPSICFPERSLCPTRDDQSKVSPHSNAVGLLGENTLDG